MGMVGCFAAVDDTTLERLRAEPDALDAFLNPDDDAPSTHAIDVDKAWHGIHYLLNAHDHDNEPLRWAIFGGEEFGADQGYGPPRLLHPEQVQRIAGSLIDEAVLRARFAPQAMEAAQIYPQVIWVRDGSEALDYVVANYRELVTFYRAAAERGDGVLLWLS